MMQHLPVLIVIVPLLFAPLCVLFPRGRWSWLLAALGSLASFAFALKMAFYVNHYGPMEYFLGGWLPPVGIAYRVDLLAAFLLVIVTGSASVLMAYALRTVPVEVGHARERSFYAMFLLCLSGLIGMVVTNDIFNIYVFLEIASLAAYALIATARDRKALTASFEYLILGTLGATFYLIGIGLLYMVTGTLNITDIAARLPQVGFVRPVQAAFAFITLGLLLKIAVFPLHVWLVNAYANSPSFVASFLSAVAAKVSIYVLIRILYDVFGWGFSFSAMPLEEVFLLLGVAGVLVGSLVAMYEKNLRRRLAFSSIAQMGYILVGIGLATYSGLTFALLQMLTHALAKTALFVAVGMMLYRAAATQLDDIRGLGKVMPATFAGFTLAGLSLIGIPGTAGFIAKWYFLAALIEGGHWALLVVVVASTLMAVVYIWQIIEAAFLEKRPAGAPELEEAPLSQHAALWVLVAANIFFGFNAHYSLDFIRAIARTLLLPGVG